MQKSAALIKKAGIIPFLQLATKRQGGGTDSTGPHSVVLIEDKIIKGTDYQTGKQIFMVRYVVEENGEKKRYEVPVKDRNGEVHYLIQRMSQYQEGETVVMEYVRKGMKGYIDVRKPDKPEGVPTINSDGEEIPVVEDKPDEIFPTDSSEAEGIDPDTIFQSSQ